MIWSCKLFKLKPAMHIQIAHSIGHPIICYKANPVICITREQRTKPCLSARFTQNLAHFYRTSEISWGGELERPAVQSAWCYTLNLVHVTNLTNPGVFFTTTPERAIATLATFAPLAGKTDPPSLPASWATFSRLSQMNMCPTLLAIGVKTVLVWVGWWWVGMSHTDIY